MPVGQLTVVRRIRPGCRDDQDLFRDRLKVGAEMHGTFESKDLLRGRLDAEMTEHALIGRLLPTAGHDGAHTVHRQQGHGAELHAIAAIEGAGREKVSVAVVEGRTLSSQSFAGVGRQDQL